MRRVAVIDSKGRLQLPVKLRRKLNLAAGDEVIIIQKSSRRFEINFPAAEILGRIHFEHISAGAAQELSAQGFSVVCDADRKEVVLQRN